MQGLSEWLSEYRLKWDSEPETSEAVKIRAAEKSLKKAEHDIDTLRRQLSRTHDLLEQACTILILSSTAPRDLTVRISEAENRVEALSNELASLREQEESKRTIIPKVENLLEVYDTPPERTGKK